MKKVGIITFHAATNFGATLQAYALYQFIKDQGFEVEIIDYQPSRMIWEYRKLKYLSHRILPNKNIVKNIIKSIKNEKFRSLNIKVSDRRYKTREELKEGCKIYDIVICGSDEIWNVDSKFTGFDGSYFLDFIEKEEARKISYAPSFGWVKDMGEQKNKICDLLKEFDAVSVRDTNSINLVRECNVSAEKVLDPTFLGEYSKITELPQTPEEYVLVYGFLSREEGDYVKAVAREAGLTIIAIGESWKGSPKQTLIGISPETWLGYFAKATYVFTNFYHGSIFSIIFRKPFTVFVRPEKSIKVVDLLTEMEFKNRMINQGTLPKKPVFNTEIDFNEEKIEGMIRKSKEYILKALGVEKSSD